MYSLKKLTKFHWVVTIIKEYNQSTVLGTGKDLVRKKEKMGQYNKEMINFDDITRKTSQLTWTYHDLKQ